MISVSLCEKIVKVFYDDLSSKMHIFFVVKNSTQNVKFIVKCFLWIK